MQISLYFLFGLLFSLPVIAQSTDREVRLKELDRIVAFPEKYEQQKEERIAVLKAERARTVTEADRFEADAKLVEEYKVYIADSALHYVQEQLYLAQKLGDRRLADKARMMLAEVRIITGMYREAQDLLSVAGSPGLSEDLKGYYYHCTILCTAQCGIMLSVKIYSRSTNGWQICTGILC